MRYLPIEAGTSWRIRSLSEIGLIVIDPRGERVTRERQNGNGHQRDCERQTGDQEEHVVERR
jgi:hypothetical protein